MEETFEEVAEELPKQSALEEVQLFIAGDSIFPKEFLRGAFLLCERKHGAARTVVPVREIVVKIT